MFPGKIAVSQFLSASPIHPGDPIAGRDGEPAGFSLIELLVAVAVVVLLLGLVTTGLQAARESARRLQCGNHLRQLGLGLHLHHQALGCLPPSRGGPDSTAMLVWGDPPTLRPYPAPGFGAASGFVMLLPYIGEEGLHVAVVSAGYPRFFDVIYQTAKISSLLCPTDPAARSHSYLFSIGDRFGGFSPSLISPPPSENVAFQRSLRGLFGLHSRVRFESVRDGLANTIALSECVRPTGLSRIVAAGETVGGISYSGIESEAVRNDRFAISMSNPRPTACLASFSGSGFRERSTLMTMYRSPGGWLWSYGRPSVVSFSTVLPPNGPRCSDYETVGSLTPQSRHVGGVFAVMADGAVRFVADDIDAGDPSAPERLSGPSPYGVWGALGSRAGSDAFAILP
jgi:prepilin-type N-terminal cleavage/methylation domain-containing protein